MGVSSGSRLRAEPPDTTAPPAANAAAPASAGHGATDVKTQPGAPCAPGEASSGSSPTELHICTLLIAPSGEPANGQIALNDKLAIVLDGKLPHPADQYVLFLNDREVKGLEPPIYTTVDSQRALVFKLVRNADNLLFWKELLGAPKRKTVRVTVGLGERAESCPAGQPCKQPDITIKSPDPSKPAAFEFNLIDGYWLAIAALSVALVIGLLWGHSRTSTTLRDNLVPQLPPGQQTYSLARWQMAFWFVLILGSFIFLYVLLWDYDTVSIQALALMGISGATALAAVTIDVAKDSPADLVNRALQALGLNSYADVLRVQQEIEVRKPQVVAAQTDFDSKNAIAAQAKRAADEAPGDQKLNELAKTAKGVADASEEQLKRVEQEIQDRNNVLRTYEDKTQPFRSQGWLKDITTDLNGPALHRIQVLCWTVALGAVFLIGVYRDLAMPPDFSATLLALMGISSAGYIGFKYPEKNS